jgi:2-phosphoglycerate kinase
MEPNWTCLLIGGGSGVGKTHLAQQLAQRYGISHMEADDLRVALRTVTNREEHSELFTFVDHQNYLEEFTQDQFIEKTLEAASTVWVALDSIITKHIGFSERIVLEGDSMIPSLLAQRNQEGLKAIFLYDDLEHIRDRQIKRNRNKKRTPEKMEINAQFAYAYSETLRKQAEEHGFQTIQASPIETLFDRVSALLE